MDVYLLTAEECKLLRDQNVQGAQISPCDYGLGPCIEIETLGLKLFEKHRDVLEPLEKREIVRIEVREM